MALKESNKNRKKIKPSQTQDNPIKSWWWFPNKPKLYIVGFGLLLFVLLFLV